MAKLLNKLIYKTDESIGQRTNFRIKGMNYENTHKCAETWWSIHNFR